ncbi:MAG: TldD/PmbA family protein [Prevotellaceae bacterium]|jgi:PmbA protein|nr:TldD/PmbA family protein [Prevotellaceae bacterium]
MISAEYKSLAREAMQFALDRGADSVRISVCSGADSAFEYRDKNLDRLQQASENRMEIELFADNRYGLYSTNRMEKESLFKFIASAIESTLCLDKDPMRTLPDSSRYYRGDMFVLDTYDEKFDTVNTGTKLALARNMVDEIYGIDSKIISITAEYSDGYSFRYMISSNGFEGETSHSSYSLCSSVAMKGGGDARPCSSWYESALHFDNLVKNSIGKKAYERTLQKLGQTKINSGKYLMLLDNTQSASLLSPIISAMFGNAIHQKNSFLIDRLNEKIFPDKLTVTDEPHIKRAFGARMFDCEGVATMKRTLIDKGVLKMYFTDTYDAAKLKMEPTVSSPSIVCFELGTRSHEQILASIDKGIWVTGFNGGNSNSCTGDFSFGIEGFLIEKGKPTKPVNEMNVTGNLLRLWNNILEIGNDPKPNSSRRVPSLLFKDVSFSGTGGDE